MKTKPRHDYGKCHTCGGPMEEKHINQEFWIRGKLIVIEDLPAGVCKRCGEKVVSAEIGRQVAALIERPKLLNTSRKMTVAVIPFVKEVA